MSWPGHGTRTRWRRCWPGAPTPAPQPSPSAAGRAWWAASSRGSATARRARCRSTFERGAEAVRQLSQSGLEPANCRLLDGREAMITGAATDDRALLVLGFESADHPLGPWMDRALECCADHGGEWSEVRERRPGSAD